MLIDVLTRDPPPDDEVPPEEPVPDEEPEDDPDPAEEDPRFEDWVTVMVGDNSSACGVVLVSVDNTFDSSCVTAAC